MAESLTTPTTTCTKHCGACGCHFHSLESFDAHRQGDYTSNDPETGRHCVHPFDMDGRLTTLTEHGECRIYENADPAHRGEGIQHNVTIWTTAGYEQAGQRLRHAAQTPGRARSGHESITKGVGAAASTNNAGGRNRPEGQNSDPRRLGSPPQHQTALKTPGERNFLRRRRSAFGPEGATPPGSAA